MFYIIKIRIVVLIKKKGGKKMVINFIYEKYEEQIMASLREVFDDKKIETLYVDGSIRDMVLKQMAKALTITVFRNGLVEDIHSGVFSEEDGTKISQKYMKELNIDVCNRIYTMLSLLMSNDSENNQKTYDIFKFGSIFSNNWDEPLIEKSLVGDK